MGEHPRPGARWVVHVGAACLVHLPLMPGERRGAGVQSAGRKVAGNANIRRWARFVPQPIVGIGSRQTGTGSGECDGEKQTAGAKGNGEGDEIALKIAHGSYSLSGAFAPVCCKCELCFAAAIYQNLRKISCESTCSGCRFCNRENFPQKCCNAT